MKELELTENAGVGAGGDQLRDLIPVNGSTVGYCGSHGQQPFVVNVIGHVTSHSPDEPVHG